MLNQHHSFILPNTGVYHTLLECRRKQLQSYSEGKATLEQGCVLLTTVKLPFFSSPDFFLSGDSVLIFSESSLSVFSSLTVSPSSSSQTLGVPRKLSFGTLPGVESCSLSPLAMEGGDSDPGECLRLRKEKNLDFS